MSTFLVVVSKDLVHQFWVDAESKEEAEALAKGLVDEIDSCEWEETDFYVDVMDARRIMAKPSENDVIFIDGEWELVNGLQQDTQTSP